MLYRLKQLYSALTAAVTEEERGFISAFLLPREEEFFYEMSVVDQRHALDAAGLVYDRLKKDGLLEEEKLLIRATLLHDAGKRHGDLTVLDRSLIVFLERFFPKLIGRWAVKGRGGFIQNRRHALYVAKYHGQMGAERLELIGSSELVIRLVRDHHVLETKDWRMLILQEADRLS